MTEDQLYFLQQVMLFTDGVLVVASAWIAYYWSGSKNTSKIIKGLFIFFLVKAVVSVALAVSDTFVIHKISVWYTTLPIIRGLWARVPEALAEAFLLYLIYGRTKIR